MLLTMQLYTSLIAWAVSLPDANQSIATRALLRMLRAGVYGTTRLRAFEGERTSDAARNRDTNNKLPIFTLMVPHPARAVRNPCVLAHLTL